MTSLHRRVAAMACVCVFGCARPPTGPVTRVVVTSTQERVRVVIRTRADGDRIGACRTPCDVVLREGEYLVEVRGSRYVPSARDGVRIEGPTRVEIDPGSTDGEAGGIIVGTLGIAALTVGTLLGMPCVIESETSVHKDCTVPGVLFVGGLLTTIVGWSVFKISHTRIEATPMRSSAPIVSWTGGSGTVGWAFSF
jgi:hypothetical protein